MEDAWWLASNVLSATPCSLSSGVFSLRSSGNSFNLHRQHSFSVFAAVEKSWANALIPKKVQIPLSLYRRIREISNFRPVHRPLSHYCPLHPTLVFQLSLSSHRQILFYLFEVLSLNAPYELPCVETIIFPVAPAPPPAVLASRFPTDTAT